MSGEPSKPPSKTPSRAIKKAAATDAEPREKSKSKKDMLLSQSAPARLAWQPPPPPISRPVISTIEPPPITLTPAPKTVAVKAWGSANAFSCPTSNPYLEALTAVSDSLGSLVIPETPEDRSDSSRSRTISAASSGTASKRTSTTTESSSLGRSPTILGILSESLDHKRGPSSRASSEHPLVISGTSRSHLTPTEFPSAASSASLSGGDDLQFSLDESTATESTDLTFPFDG